MYRKIIALAAVSLLIAGCGGPEKKQSDVSSAAESAAVAPLRAEDPKAARDIVRAKEPGDVMAVAARHAVRKQVKSFIANNDWKNVTSRVTDKMTASVLVDADDANRKLILYKPKDSGDTYAFFVEKDEGGARITGEAELPYEAPNTQCTLKESWVDQEMSKFRDRKFVAWGPDGYPISCAIPDSLFEAAELIEKKISVRKITEIDELGMSTPQNTVARSFIDDENTRLLFITAPESSQYGMLMFARAYADGSGCDSDFVGFVKVENPS